MKHLASGLLLTVLFLSLAVSPASAWDLAPCGAEHQQSRAAFAKALRQAKPGSPIYVPHPFPQKDQEVVDNFLSYHRTAFEDTPFDALSPEEQRFFSALADDRLHFEVLRVANWTRLRCRPDRDRAFYFLIRMFDGEGGPEITRVAVSSDGILSSLAHRPMKAGLEQYPLPVPQLDLAASLARAIARSPRLGDGQLVATDGTLRCPPLRPCVALRDGQRAYLVRDEKVLRLGRPDQTLTLPANLGRAERQAVIDRHRRRDEHLVTLGGDRVVVAVPVGE